MKKILGYLLAGAMAFALTFCKDKKDKTPEPIQSSDTTKNTISNEELLAGKTLKTYKLSSIKYQGADYTTFLLSKACQRAYLYDFRIDNRFFQRKGDPACTSDKDTLIVNTWQFNKTKDTLIIGAGLGTGKIKELNSSSFILVKDTLGFEDVEITMIAQ